VGDGKWTDSLCGAAADAIRVSRFSSLAPTAGSLGRCPRGLRAALSRRGAEEAHSSRDIRRRLWRWVSPALHAVGYTCGTTRNGDVFVARGRRTLFSVRRCVALNPAPTVPQNWSSPRASWAPTSSAPIVSRLTPSPGSQPPMTNSLRERWHVLIQAVDRTPGKKRESIRLLTMPSTALSRAIARSSAGDTS
jgi:hypothetical protein